MCSLQRNYDVIRNWERFETGPLTVSTTTATRRQKYIKQQKPLEESFMGD